MKREEWKFQYNAKDLALAAKVKRDHHKQRLEWWEQKQSDVIAEVKEKGLEVSESIAMEYATSQFSGSLGSARGAQLVVKNDYQQKLNECNQKMRSHDGKVREYNGWLQVLEANDNQTLELDIEDYLFFFGK